MPSRWHHPLIIGGALIALLMVLLACGNSGSIVAGTTATAPLAPTATATLVPTATATFLPTATPAPAPGVCNVADFPTKTNGGPDLSFQYPPLTYHGGQDAAAGTYRYFMCSSGNPTSILAFLEHSLPAGGWTHTATTATTLNAVQTSVPQEGLCASVNVTVGSHSGYPGEWDAYFHSPTSSCKVA